MKTIIIILVILFSTTIYAENKIPGYLELDLNTGNYYDFSGDDKHNFGYSEVKIKYGEEFDWFQPIDLYGFCSWKTFFIWNESNIISQYPYRDIYSWGLGFQMKIFYFEYEHRCSHAVFTGGDIDNGREFTGDTEENFIQFEGMPTLSYDSFKVGIKLRID